MAIELTTPQILEIAKASQYMTVINIANQQVLKGGDVNQRQARLIYIVRKSVQNRYDLNPSDPTLVATGNYLFSLLRNWPAAQNRINAVAGGVPVITNPSNVNIVVGQNAVFTVAVTSSSSYTVQWYRNGSAIVGATGLSYTLTNGQLSDSGSLFNAVATNSAGSEASLTASLTVTTSLSLQWWFGPADPFPDLSVGIDTLSYQISQAFANPAVINYPSGAENNQFNVLRYPSTQNDFTVWVNVQTNQGTIPDFVMRPILNINGFKYVISKNAMSLDPITTTLTYS